MAGELETGHSLYGCLFPSDICAGNRSRPRLQVSPPYVHLSESGKDRMAVRPDEFRYRSGTIHLSSGTGPSFSGIAPVCEPAWKFETDPGIRQKQPAFISAVFRYRI